MKNTNSFMAFSPCPVLFAIIFSFFLFHSVSAKKIPTSRPEMIKAVCKTVRDSEGCRRIVMMNPHAASAKDLISMARAVIWIGITHAQETLDFINRTIKTDPTVKTTFEQCAEYYDHIYNSMKGAAGDELRKSPRTSNYDVMVTSDDTRMTMDAIAAAKDGTSVNALKEKTLQMNRFINLGAGATDAVAEYYKDI